MLCCISMIIIGFVLAYLFFKSDANPLLKLYELIYPNQDKLRNKTVWVVGASTGIGEELAYQLAELNCRLILTSTSKDKLNEVKEKCLKRSTGLKSDDILVVAYDISDQKESDKAFKQIIDKFGDVDIVVNNAARVTTQSSLDDIDLSVHRKIFDINYFGNIYIAKIVVKHWLDTKSQGLKIIAPTSSIGAYCDMCFFSTYISTKKALNTFYRDLALQHEDISVCLIVPGPTDTALGDKAIIQGNRRLTVENEKSMSSKRCAQLSLIAIANRLSESWVCEQPWLFFTYLSERYSYQMHNVAKLVGAKSYFEKRFIKKVN